MSLDRCFSSFPFQNQVLFSSWESIFSEHSSKMRENVPLYSFDGRDILRDSAWWVFVYPGQILIRDRVCFHAWFKLVVMSFFPLQAREDGLARIERKGPPANGSLLWNVAGGRARRDGPGVVPAERPPAAADPQQLLRLLRRPLHRERLHVLLQIIHPSSGFGVLVKHIFGNSAGKFWSPSFEMLP